MAGGASSGARVADAAALATAAEDIRNLLRWAPERILWAPDRAVWGLALFANRGQILISLDGCLTIAMTLWPAHYQPAVMYPYDAIARLLSRHFKLKKSGDSILFEVVMDHSASGACCCIGSQEDLQLLQDDVLLTPIITPTSWQSPQSLDHLQPLTPTHPVLCLIGRRPACATAASFFAMVGEAPDAVILPMPGRADQLRTWWRYHLQLERERLRLAEQDIPPWLLVDQVPEDLVVAWMGGWRSGDVPAPRPPTAPVAPRPPASTPTATAVSAPAEPPALRFGGNVGGTSAGGDEEDGSWR